MIQWVQRIHPEHPGDVDMDPDALVDDLAQKGASQIINLVYPLRPGETESLNQFNADLAAKHRNVTPVGSLHPGNENKKDLMRRAFEEQGLMGLKFHGFVQKIDLRDPAMEEVWTWCERWQRPVYLHTGFDYYYRKTMNAECLESILHRHPELPLVISHLLFPRLEDAYGLARKYPGIYLDASGLMLGMQKYGEDLLRHDGFGMQELIDITRSGLREFEGRVIFGSDYPVCGGSLSDVSQSLDLLELSLDELRMLRVTAPRKFIETFSNN